MYILETLMQYSIQNNFCCKSVILYKLSMYFNNCNSDFVEWKSCAATTGDYGKLTYLDGQ
jgi:hypothetical protein